MGKSQKCGSAQSVGEAGGDGSVNVGSADAGQSGDNDSAVEYQDTMDLVIIYRVDMPNGDALFFRGMRDHKTEFEYFMT